RRGVAGALYFLPSNQLPRDAPGRAEVGGQGVALVRQPPPGKRARQHEMARLERNAVASELIGEPCDPERGMTEHPGGNAGLLDLGILVHDAAHPAQVDVERSDRPTADDDPAAAPLSAMQLFRRDKSSS